MVLRLPDAGDCLPLVSAHAVKTGHCASPPPPASPSCDRKVAGKAPGGAEGAGPRGREAVLLSHQLLYFGPQIN